MAMILTLLSGFLIPGHAFSEIYINEIQVNTTGTDWEFFELRGPPGADLSNLTLVVIESDFSSSAGIIDLVISLSGQRIPEDGFWLGINSTGAAAYGVTGDLTIEENSFENSTATYFLVSGFSGTQGSDLDYNKDGILDSTPWDSLLDSINLRDSDLSDFNYGAPSVGPDGSFMPSGAFRFPDAPDGTFEYNILNFNTPDGTPGEANCPANIIVSPTTINFGSVLVGENSSHKEVNIQNTGGISLYPLTKLSDWKNFALDVNGGSNPCGLDAVLTFGSTCTVTAWFKPASKGIFSKTLTITSNDPDESEVIVTLNGTGCSSFLTTESEWYEIQGIPEDTQTVIIRATLTNKDSFGRDLSFSEETFQLWGYPIDPDADVIDIPKYLINIFEEPTGTVIQDATFTYHFKVNLSKLPYIPKLGFRVQTVEGGTMRPSDVPVNDSCVMFITKTKTMPWIPLLLLD